MLIALIILSLISILVATEADPTNTPAMSPEELSLPADKKISRADEAEKISMPRAVELKRGNDVRLVTL